MGNVIKWTLRDAKSGDTLLPQTILEQVFADSSLRNQIATGGVIRREYMTHDIMVLVDVVEAVADEPGVAHPPDISSCEKGDRYYDFGTNTLYLLWTTSSSDPTLKWYPGVPDLDRMFVSKLDKKLYRSNGTMLIEVSKESSFTLVDI